MSTPGINVFARFKAKAGREDDVRRALLDMIEPTLGENANIGYALHRSNDDPRVFWLYEQWSDRAGLDAHMKQPYFAKLERALDGALETPMEVVVSQMIGGETSPAAVASTASA